MVLEISAVCDSNSPAFNVILPRSYDLFWSHLTSDMRAMHVFILVALWPLMEASASCAKSSSLLSLKADMSKNAQGVAESNGSNATTGTACQNCSMTNSSNHTLNPKLEELVKNVLQNDMNESADMPDPVGDASGGSLGQNLEFLYLKVVSWHSGLLVPKHQTMLGKHVKHYGIRQGPAHGRWSTRGAMVKTFSYYKYRMVINALHLLQNQGLIIQFTALGFPI